MFFPTTVTTILTANHAGLLYFCPVKASKISWHYITDIYFSSFIHPSLHHAFHPPLIQLKVIEYKDRRNGYDEKIFGKRRIWKYSQMRSVSFTQSFLQCYLSVGFVTPHHHYNTTVELSVTYFQAGKLHPLGLVTSWPQQCTLLLCAISDQCQAKPQEGAQSAMGPLQRQ